MTEKLHTKIDFLGPPSRLRLAASDVEAFASARAARWPEGLNAGDRARPPLLRRTRAVSNMSLRLDPLTRPGEYTVILEFADGGQREVSVSVEPQPRLRATPGTLRFTGSPAEPVSTRLLLENYGNVGITIGNVLVTGVFDDNGFETAIASTYRMENDDLNINKVLENFFSRLRDAHGGLLPLQVVEGSGELAPGERRVLVLKTTLKSKLRPGHNYHGVLKIGEYEIAVHLAIEGSDTDNKQGGAAQ
jgi:hypothetical protein